MKPNAVLRLSMVFSLMFCVVGCSKNSSESDKKRSATIPHEMSFPRRILDIQVSRGDTVFICDSVPSDWSADMTEEDYAKIKSARTNLGDVYSCINEFKKKQDQTLEMTFCVIGGDDLAKCSSIIAVLENAKRIGIKKIYFDTAWRKSGDVSMLRLHGGDGVIQHVDFPSFEKDGAVMRRNAIRLTITAENTIQWDNELISLEEYVARLYNHAGDYSSKGSPVAEKPSENIPVEIELYEEANYASLRYVIDQLRRARFVNISVEARKTK